MECSVSRGTLAIITGVFHMQINIVAAIYFRQQYKQQMEVDRTSGSNFVWFVSSILCIMAVFLSISMIAGVCMKCYKLMQPYVQFGVLCLTVSGLVWILIIGGFIWHLEPFFELCDMITRAILIEGIQILLLMPVFSVYAELLVEARGTRKPFQTNGTTLNSTNQEDDADAEKTPVDSVV